jgi:CheY-like chemotaxis protein
MQGIQTQTARDGAEALAAVDASVEPFDVIVLDIEMPHMNGWQALKAIRQLPQGRLVPIVMFTGYGHETKARALEEGANCLVHKPLLPQEMVRVLHKVQGQASPQ